MLVKVMEIDLIGTAVLAEAKHIGDAISTS
jgi:hypothetical protein